MKSTGRSSTKQSKHKLIYFLIISTFLGLLSSSYLLINMITGVGQSCTSLAGCYFNTENYSTIFSSGVMFLPATYFFITLLLVLYFFTSQNKTLGKTLYYFANCSLLMIAFFVYLQVYIYQGLCLICMVIIAFSAMLFASNRYLPKHLK